MELTIIPGVVQGLEFRVITPITENQWKSNGT